MAFRSEIDLVWVSMEVWLEREDLMVA